jgi:lysozyme
MPNWPGDDAVFALAMPLIKEFEGYDASPYRDSAGIPTIGWGTILYPNGKPVTMQDPTISQAYAQDCVTYEMQGKSTALQRLLTANPTVHQAAAMLSLTYNIGVANFTGSTVLREFNAGNIQAAADAFLLWDKAHVNGQLVVAPGLLNRRQQEQGVFLTADS